MCGIHARSTDLAQLRSQEVRDLKNDLHRVCMQLRTLNVKCTTDGNKVILTDPEGLITRMRTIQIMTDALEAHPSPDRPRRTIPPGLAGTSWP